MMEALDSAPTLLVVRRPEYNDHVHGIFVGEPHRLDANLYCGVDRMSWEDLHEAYDAGTMPPELRSRFEELRTSSGFPLCRDVGVAEALCALSNLHGVRNEVIAVSEIDRDTGREHPDNSNFLGFDVVSPSSWSLVYAGVFAAPERFESWRFKVNKAGLFDDSRLALDYIAAYTAAATDTGPVEPLPFGMDDVQIWRVSRI